MKRIRVLIDETSGEVTEYPITTEPEKRGTACPCGCGAVVGEDERPPHYTGQYL